MVKESKYNWIAGILAVCVSVLFLGIPSCKEREMQEKIAKEILRFRVLANSDSVSDQKIKQKVKNDVQMELDRILSDAGTLEETKVQILGQMDPIRQTAQKAAGTDIVKVSLVEDWFPERTYGKYTFPEGEYETLLVKIGKAQGHNWWCVLYPELYYGDAVRLVVDEDPEEKLKQVIDEECYDFLLYPVKTRIRFRWF